MIFLPYIWRKIPPPGEPLVQTAHCPACGKLVIVDDPYCYVRKEMFTLEWKIENA